MSGHLVSGKSPPKQSRKWEIYRVVSKEPEQMVIVSKCVYGTDVHWWQNRSHECRLSSGSCKGCQDGWPVRWKGYLHVARPSGDWQGFWEFTTPVFNALALQLGDRFNFRGCIVRVGKTKGGPKGRYLVEILERTIAEEDLPVPADPLDTLRFLWNARKAA